MMRQLVPEGALDLAAEQLLIEAEVALERVLVEHDAVLEVLARDRVAVVVAVRAVLGAALGDHYGRRLQKHLELDGQPVDRVGYEQLELRGLLGELRMARELLGAAHQALELLL